MSPSRENKHEIENYMKILFVLLSKQKPQHNKLVMDIIIVKIDLMSPIVMSV